MRFLWFHLEMMGSKSWYFFVSKARINQALQQLKEANQKILAVEQKIAERDQRIQELDHFIIRMTEVQPTYFILLYATLLWSLWKMDGLLPPNSLAYTGPGLRHGSSWHKVLPWNPRAGYCTLHPFPIVTPGTWVWDCQMPTLQMCKSISRMLANLGHLKWVYNGVSVNKCIHLCVKTEVRTLVSPEQKKNRLFAAFNFILRVFFCRHCVCSFQSQHNGIHAHINTSVDEMPTMS